MLCYAMICTCRYTTVEKLQQSYLFIPSKYKVLNVLVQFVVMMWCCLPAVCLMLFLIKTTYTCKTVDIGCLLL